MKIAIISDIHGNIQALDAVLADIEKEKCENIYCLGDLAMAGPEPVKTTELIKKMKEEGALDLIQGNTDEMISDYDKFGPIVKEKFPIMGSALEDDAKTMPDDLKKFLSNLPKQMDLKIEGVNVLLVHGSPRKNDENITPDLPIEKVEEIVKDAKADVILCGHTHIPCGYQTTNKQTVVNVGSVGRPFTPEPQACYVVATFLNGEINIMHKFLSYDKEKAAEILANRKFEGAKKLSSILLKPEFRHM